MNMQIFIKKSWISLLSITVLAVGSYSLATGAVSLLTPDQQGYRFYERGEFGEAAIRFADPMWTGIVLFRQGEFEKSAGAFAGIDTADSTFNHGNALVMQGKYEEAADRYMRALELKPDWEVLF
jgi:Ca-activated chloride channel family protein